MKKINKAAWLVSACMLIIAAVSVFFLPGELAIQWNEAGISNTASKWVLLLFPALAALCIVLHVIQGSKQEGNGADSLWYFAGILVLFAAEVVIICNGLRLIEITKADSRLVTRSVAIILGCLLVYFGNRLPKTARNYYVGVKAPWAFENDDIWTKTQRFAAKVWVISGIRWFCCPSRRAIYSPVLWRRLFLLLFCFRESTAGVFMRQDKIRMVNKGPARIVNTEVGAATL